MKEALKKARKARGNLAKALSDLEEALRKASSKLRNRSKVSAQGWSASLNKSLAKVKAVLQGQKTFGIDEIRKISEAAAQMIKGAKDEIKELRAVGGKASSVVSQGSKAKK